MSREEQERILVIRHGALGDVVLSTGPFAAIRKYHPRAHITLLTGKPYDTLLASSPYFDKIAVDGKQPFWRLGELYRRYKFFRDGRFKRVYDLQTSERSTWYYHLFPFPRPEFSGLARWASHRHDTRERTKLHTIDRQKQQLAIAGITDVPPPDVSWLKGRSYRDWEQEARAGIHNACTERAREPSASEASPIAQRQEARAGALNSSYALLVPGGSAHRPEKRWPAEKYAELAVWLVEQGIQPVLIGTGAESEILEQIASSVPSVLNLCNQTSFADIAELARGAQYAVGNDTGPMHLIVAAGCPSVILFNTTASNPELCAPRGEGVAILKHGALTALPVETVVDALKNRACSVKN